VVERHLVPSAPTQNRQGQRKGGQDHDNGRSSTWRVYPHESVPHITDKPVAQANRESSLSIRENEQFRKSKCSYGR
jgi:hypothetical protein